MEQNPEKKNDWLAERVPGTIQANPEYPEIERAHKCWSYFQAGYDELQIAALLELDEMSVTRDIAYIFSKMSSRQQVAARNDRHRILIQKAEADQYSKMIKDSFSGGVDKWLNAGLSPVPAMKEYRQAVGMDEKPGGISINVTNTKQSATFINNPPGHIPPENLGGGGIKCFEDLLRMIIATDPTCGLQPAIDIDRQDVTPPENQETTDGDESIYEPEDIDDSPEYTSDKDEDD